MRISQYERNLIFSAQFLELKQSDKKDTKKEEMIKDSEAFVLAESLKELLKEGRYTNAPGQSKE